MKKILNDMQNIVQEMCEGMLAAHPEILHFDRESKVVSRKTPNPDKVSLISGGGSGHEPAHAGYVGVGMLDAAVCGDVFASPSTIQVYRALQRTRSNKGTLLIVKNYSGDCMNFDGAAEMAEDDGIVVERVYVNDDVAVKDSLYTVGRRGVAGTFFVHKIAGAAAERLYDLAEVKRVAEKVIENVRSIGFALTSCTVPAKGTPTFLLADNEMEYGVGIHGEPGIAREPIQQAHELAHRMVTQILAEPAMQGIREAAVLVNGFGSTPLMELYVMNKNICEALESRGVQCVKVLVGNYMTSLDMCGASLSVLRLDDEIKELLVDPAVTAAVVF